MCLNSTPADLSNHPLAICLVCGELGHAKCSIKRKVELPKLNNEEFLNWALNGELLALSSKYDFDMFDFLDYPEKKYFEKPIKAVEPPKEESM